MNGILEKYSLSVIPIAWLFDINYAAVSKAVGRSEKKIEEDGIVSEMSETIGVTPPYSPTLP